MLNRLMKERSDLLPLLIRLKHKTALKYVLLMKNYTLNVEDEVLRERMERSIAALDESHERMMVNEADMDFRIPGLPHSVVKYAQSTSVRQLIQKIENHPDRHALQQDLRQNHSFDPFSTESKQLIRCWQHRVMWNTRDGIRNAVHSMFIILEHWYTLLHVRAFLAQRKRGESAIHQLYDWPSFSSGVRHQERTTSRTSIWSIAGRQGIPYG